MSLSNNLDCSSSNVFKSFTSVIVCLRFDEIISICVRGFDVFIKRELQSAKTCASFK